MRLDVFDYELPEELIAKTPASPRDHSRLLAVDRKTGTLSHQHFHEIERLLRPGDLLVLNDTRVIPARLFGEDSSGRRFESLLLERADSLFSWNCLAKPGKRVSEDTTLRFSGGIRGRLERAEEGRFRIHFRGFSSESQFWSWLEENGALPLPPYLKRPASPADRTSYQTIYAREPGSVAAPTAGLHFTPALLDRLRDNGIRTTSITLHIGYGTFSPIRAQEIEEHVMHEENYEITSDVLETLVQAKQEGRRIIAVGTTSLRALESMPRTGRRGRTRLFIQPGHEFQWASGLITNFHLPKSSLYILVASFLGLGFTRAAYEEAVRRTYRFFSYGDAMIIV